MRRAVTLALGLALAAPPLTAQQVVTTERTVAANHVSLRGLDTLNGTTRDLELDVGETLRYGHLEVTAEACAVPEADPEGDAQAYLRIRDLREEAPRFSGWMFASSPALSALDHPRYDIWVLSCSRR